ncbi:MAG: hypothetical protein KDA88_17600 [Planctomycetaceae bacterium]|nr:hypothetical protein [Planctomycetaceae bacterium]MCB9954062.1 hypothetical protein [Planctomycetaceae bacterium]
MDIPYPQLAVNLSLLVAFPVAILIVSRTRYFQFSRWRGRIFAVANTISLVASIAYVALTGVTLFFPNQLDDLLYVDGISTNFNNFLKVFPTLLYVYYGGHTVALCVLGSSRVKGTAAAGSSAPAGNEE